MYNKITTEDILALQAIVGEGNVFWGEAIITACFSGK